MATTKEVYCEQSNVCDKRWQPDDGEIDAILVAIGTDPSVVTDIKDRVDAQLAEEELAPADADRFKQAVDWLTELGVIVSNKVGVISIGHLDRLDWIRWA